MAPQYFLESLQDKIGYPQNCALFINSIHFSEISVWQKATCIYHNLLLPALVVESLKDPFAICQIFRPKFKIHISNIFSYHPSNLQVRQTHSLLPSITQNQQLQQQLLTYQFIILKTVIELLKWAMDLLDLKDFFKPPKNLKEYLRTFLNILKYFNRYLMLFSSFQ